MGTVLVPIPRLVRMHQAQVHWEPSKVTVSLVLLSARTEGETLDARRGGPNGLQKPSSLSGLAGKFRCCGGSGSEKQIVKILFAHDPTQFPEGEERNESAEYDQGTAEELIDLYLPEPASDTLVMQK
jgi:hypothetical protein